MLDEIPARIDQLGAQIAAAPDEQKPALIKELLELISRLQADQEKTTTPRRPRKRKAPEDLE